MMNEFLTIDTMEFVTKIMNHSDFNIKLSFKPERPKRKIIDFMIIPAHSFRIDESHLDFSKIYISFEEVK